MLNENLKIFIDEHFKQSGTSLDLGCGDKHDVDELNKLGWLAEGVDLPGVDLNNVYESGKKFDLVYSLSVLQFVDTKENFIKTVRNNLKDGGWFFIQTFTKEDPVFKDKGMNEDELGNILSSFKNVKIFKKSITDNHAPLGEHKHELLIAYGQN